MKVLQNIKIALRRLMIRRNHSDSDAAKASYVDLTRTLIKCALDNSKWKYQFDEEEDCFYGTLSVDDTTEVLLALKPLANCIQAQATVMRRYVDSLKLTDALLFCNKWNSKSLFPKAYIEDCKNQLVGETVMTFDENADEEFIRECLLASLFDACIAWGKEVCESGLLTGSISDS